MKDQLGMEWQETYDYIQEDEMEFEHTTHDEFECPGWPHCEEWATYNNPDWWQPSKNGSCWICQTPTSWVYADQTYQHPTCDMWPSEHGTNRAVIVIKGIQVTCNHGYEDDHDWEDDTGAYVCLGKDQN